MKQEFMPSYETGVEMRLMPPYETGVAWTSFLRRIADTYMPTLIEACNRALKYDTVINLFLLTLHERIHDAPASEMRERSQHYMTYKQKKNSMFEIQSCQIRKWPSSMTVKTSFSFRRTLASAISPAAAPGAKTNENNFLLALKMIRVFL
jgi:hypothetical protein